MTKAKYSKSVPCRDAFGKDTRVSVTLYDDDTLRVVAPLLGADLTDDQAVDLAQAIGDVNQRRNDQ